MIDITMWMQNFLHKLNETFANRVWFVGLQGSYGRGEATEASDIDVVVILDELSAMDIQAQPYLQARLQGRRLRLLRERFAVPKQGAQHRLA